MSLFMEIISVSVMGNNIQKDVVVSSLGPLLLVWINLNPNMDK